MTTFSVKNFEKFQHYKDRSPPWIKLYNELLDDYEFGLLPDASKMHLVAIWLLASRSENKIPFDPAWVARRINATEQVNLRLLADRGFILLDQPLHTAEQVASEPIAERLPRGEGQVEDIEQEREKRDAALPLGDVPARKERRQSKRATTFPEDFLLTEPRRKYAADHGFTGIGAERMFEAFRNHHQSKGTVFADWDAGWRKWVSNQVAFNEQRTNRVSGGMDPRF
jgi:hypothetical protein